MSRQSILKNIGYYYKTEAKKIDTRTRSPGLFRVFRKKNCIMSEKKNKYLQVILSWLFVGIPLLWGILQTVKKSLTLFN
jgi:hypothetical protein